MAPYLTLLAILILSLATAIWIDRKWKNLAIGIAGGLAVAAAFWFIATMFFYWFVPS